MSWRDWFRSWRQPTPRRLDRWQVVLYTRQGCHLCETAWQLLTDAQKRHGFYLRPVDIDTDPALVADHGEHVPVVAVNGKVRFRGVVNPVLLRRLFETGG
jgi:glutaredoxin